MADKEEMIGIELFEKRKDGFYRAGGTSITRQEAIEKMAKAICAKDFYEECKEDCEKCACRNEKECSLVIVVSKYIKLAEAALNALLGVEE